MQSLSVKPKIPERNIFEDRRGKKRGEITSDLAERDALLDSTNISIEIRALSKDETSTRHVRRGKRPTYAM